MNSTSLGLREQAQEWLDKHVPLQFIGSSTEPVGVTHIDKESMSDVMAEFAKEQQVAALKEAEKAAVDALYDERISGPQDDRNIREVRAAIAQLRTQLTSEEKE